MRRSGMPWLFVVSLLAAGIIFLVTGLRSDRASDFNINLLAAGVDFAVTSLVTAFVVERFRTLRQARDQARLYDVVTDQLTTAAHQWVAALPGTGERPTATTITDASSNGPLLDLTGTLKVAATALEPAGFDGLDADARAALADHNAQLRQRFADCLELLYTAAPSPALLEAVADFRLAHHRWAADQVRGDSADDLVANTQATLQAARAAETALGDAPSTAGIVQRTRTPVQLAVGMLLMPLPAAVSGVIWMLKTVLGRVPVLRSAVDAVPGLVSMVLGVLAVTALGGEGHWLGGVALAVGCAAAAEPYTLLAGVTAAAAKVTPDVLAGLVVVIATATVIAGWQAAAALIATAVLAATTLLVAWIQFQDRFERWARAAAGIEVTPRRLTGAGWLLAMLVWVGAAALLVVGSRLLTGPANPTPTTSPGVVVISLWCGYWVSLRWRDRLTRQPRLSRPLPHR